MDLKERITTLFPADDAIPAPFRLPGRLDQVHYLVDGQLIEWTGPRQTVLSPICTPGPAPEQRELGSYPLLTSAEALAALDAAVRAFNLGRGAWPTLSVEGRIRHVEEFARLMAARRDEVVNLLMWEIGKNLADSRKEFDRTLDYIRDTIEALKHLDRNCSRFEIEEGVIGQIRRAPLGVVLCMGPFNYPLNETFTTLIPALIMGNTVIFKPPKLGVLLHRPLLEAFRDAFPPGVVNTVYGEGSTVVGPLMASGRIDVLAFIGSSKVADLLKKQHPQPHRLRSVLGLGAKNPGIVLPDADPEATVKECLLGALSFNGQRCTALKILFVHEKLAEEFIGRFAAGLARLGLGVPWAEGAALTPLPEPGKPAYLAGLVEDALAHGARLVNPGGGMVHGTFFYPALLADVQPTMRLYHEEQFGPVVPVVTYRDLEEPIRYMTESPFGQQVSLFGRDPEVMAHLIDPLVNQVSRVNLNSQCQRGPDVFPFTGRKDSAEGTLSVSDALRVFAIRTMVAAKHNPQNIELLNRIVRERKSAFLSTDFLF